ncbi:MAG TPA: hypothetical protein VGM41_01915 [Chitinophagaceae bacterium]|jgi:hypothetical protein
MNHPLIIAASLEEPGLLTEIVEKLAACKRNSDINRIALPDDWAVIDTSSTEAFVSGTMAIAEEENQEPPVNMPFYSSFFFTCIREKKARFELEWALSLS